MPNKTLSSSFSFLITLVFILFLIMPRVAESLTVSVCESGCDFTSLEDAASGEIRTDGDVINVLPGTYVLSGTVYIDFDLTISGDDAIIDSYGVRAFQVVGPATDVTLNNLTIRNGNPYPGPDGGALLVTGGASVTINDSVFEYNRANGGGAIHNDSSTVNIYRSVFSGNRALSGGGAIWTNGGGTTRLTEVEVNGNMAIYGSGGLMVNNDGSRVEITQSTIANNAELNEGQTASNPEPGAAATFCGVVAHGQTFVADAIALSSFGFEVRLFGPAGDLNVIPTHLSFTGQVRLGGYDGPVIATAQAVAPGGTWPGGSTQTLTFIMNKVVRLTPGGTYSIEMFPPAEYFTMLDSDVNYDGGEGYCGAGAPIGSGGSDWAFRTFGGTPSDNWGIDNAGIHAFDNSSVRLERSTVSENFGDGIVIEDATLESVFSTIAWNWDNGFTSVGSLASGTFEGTLIADNGGNDCDSSDFESLGYNLVGDGTGCSITPTTGDQVGTITTEDPINAILAPLQNNGGLTSSQALGPASPAVDGAGTGCSESVDQRGVARPLGIACDIGAFELVPPLQSLIDITDPGFVAIVPDGIYQERITIGDGITLRGSGPDNVVIDASALSIPGSVITATGDFALEGITVTGGDSPDDGGGINASIDDIDVVLSDVVFDSNEALGNGGAIYIRNGSLDLDNVRFTGNSAAVGGAIYSILPNKAGEIINGFTETIDIALNNVDFDLNDAVTSGGAIYMEVGKLEGRQVTFTNNSAAEGGALHNVNSWIEFYDSDFSGNLANIGVGSAILTDNGGLDPIAGHTYGGSTILWDSTVDNNQSLLSGSTIAAIGFRAQLNLVRSTVSSNYASTPPLSAVFVSHGGDLFMHNSTVSGNAGSGIEASTTGWNGSRSVLQAQFSTITGNEVGFAGLDGSSVEFEHSIIAGNVNDGVCLDIFTSSGYNLIGDNSGCDFTPSNGDVVGSPSAPIDPLLGPLEDNGGPTLTHALLFGSPAIDAAGTSPAEGCYATTDQRHAPRPAGTACDMGAYEFVPLQMGPLVLRAGNVAQHQIGYRSYPGVVDVPIIDIPIEKLTGDTFSSPESAPLGSFPLGSFPIGSFDLRNSPMGSFPLGSFPIGSFPIGSFPLGSFPLSSIPLQSAGGWTEALIGTALEGAPLQTVTLEQVLNLSPLPDSVASIALRDLAIQGSPLASLSMQGLALGETTVADIDQWLANAGRIDTVCATLIVKDPSLVCDDTDTLLGLEMGGAPVSALSLSSLPLGSFPIGSFPLGSFPIGSFPLGSFPLGSFPLGSFPIGSFPIGSFPLGSFPLGSFPLGSFPIGSFPIGSFPIGSFPIGSFPLGSFDFDGKSFCEFYDEKAQANGMATCASLGVDPDSDTLADLVAALEDAGLHTIGSTPLGSFPMGSFPIGSFAIGSFPIGSFDLTAPPLSLLTLDDFDGCPAIDGTTDCANTSDLSGTSTLQDVETKYGTLAASPLGSFPLGSFGIAGLPMGSFPLGSFEINGAPLGSFPLGSFDLIDSPLGSFPLGSFASGTCTDCMTLADAARAGLIRDDATLADLKAAAPTEFADLTLGDILDAMTLAMIYGPGTLADIENTGDLTLGQLLIAMMLKTGFPWETIPLAQLDAQEFSADYFVSYELEVPLLGAETASFSVVLTLDDSFMYVKDSAELQNLSPLGDVQLNPIADPVIAGNEDGTQTLTFNLVMSGYTDFGYTNNIVRFRAVPALALGDFAASAEVTMGSDAPVAADNGNATMTIVPHPSTDYSNPLGIPPVIPADVLLLGHINTPDDDDYFQVVPPAAGSRVAVFISNPTGDKDMIMYEPLSTVEAKGQSVEAARLDSVPIEDDGITYQGNLTEEPNALEDVNLKSTTLASISTNRGDADEAVSSIAGNTDPFTIQVSGYNGATSDQPYTLRVKITPEVTIPTCTARSWPGSEVSTVDPAGNWEFDTNAVFLVNGARLASSDPDGPIGADAALTAINKLVNAPGITHAVVVDVSVIAGVDYAPWDANPCDADAANDIVNAITNYLEDRRSTSPELAYVTIVGSDEVIPFARKPDETSMSNESTFAGEFYDNALYGALVTRHFLSDDTYGDIDPIAWLDRYLNVPELAVGRLVESAKDIQTAAENYIAYAGVLDPQTALSAGYDFIADASQEIGDTFNTYGPILGFSVEPALIDQPGTDALNAWTRSDFLQATGLGTPQPVEQVSFNMHFDFDEALPSSGDAAGNYTDNLINTGDLGTRDLAGLLWFTVGCHSGTNVPDISVVAGAPSDDWAQSFSRLGALYLAQNAFGLGDTEAIALSERLMANFASNLNGRMTIGQAHTFAKQRYFADLGLYGEYDYKALQAATLFGLPMYRYGGGAMVADPPIPPLPVETDPVSGLSSASWSLADTGIGEPRHTSKGDLYSVDGEVQFVHFRPLQPIVRRDVTGPNGEIASGAFLTSIVTEDISVTDIAFARPVIDLGENEPEIETDEVVFPTAFTNIANFMAPSSGGGPFEPRQNLNVIVGQFTSPLDGSSSGTERLFRSFNAEVFYRPTPSSSLASASGADDYDRPEFDNVQATVAGSGGSQQVTFSVDVTDKNGGIVLRVAVLYLQSVVNGMGYWALADLQQEPGGDTWTGGGPVDLTGLSNGEVDYMVQAVDDSGNVANSTFKGLFYVARELPTVPDGSSGFTLVLTDSNGDSLDPSNWIRTQPVHAEVTVSSQGVTYVYLVDSGPFMPLTSSGFDITGDGVHIVTLQESDGSNPVTFVVLIDTTSPTVVITRPAAGEYVVQGREPAARFACLDAGSGIASCEGSVPFGLPVPSAPTGRLSFVVEAQDYARTGLVEAENEYFVVQELDIAGPEAPVPLGTTFDLIVTATDLDEIDEQLTIDWGDGKTDSVSGNSGEFKASHLYEVVGVYPIALTLRDGDDEVIQTGVFEFAVVYDPKGGFVTGGGWIDSPSGAYTPGDSADPDVVGRANFGLISKYQKGRSVPDGSTNFRFAAGNLVFDATVYDWMIITGANVRYKGEGSVNGDADLYKFMVIAQDADIAGSGVSEDGFRIKIWQEDPDGVEIVLYDNGLGDDDDGTTPLGGGSITIHQDGKK